MLPELGAQQLADVGIRVVADAPSYLGLPSECVFQMKQIGGGLDDVDFQGHAQFGAVAQHAPMVVGNSAGTKVYVVAIVELAFLLGASMLRTLVLNNGPA